MKEKRRHRGLELLMDMPILDAAAIAHFFGHQLHFVVKRKPKRILAKRGKKGSRK